MNLNATVVLLQWFTLMLCSDFILQGKVAALIRWGGR